MAETVEGCYTCRYFIPGARNTGKDGTCHRYAPAQWQDETPPKDEPSEPDDNGNVMLTLQTVQMYTGWPDVRQSDWCGEHAVRR